MTHPLLTPNDEGLLPCRCGAQAEHSEYRDGVIYCKSIECACVYRGDRDKWNNPAYAQALRAAEDTIEAMAKALETEAGFRETCRNFDPKIEDYKYWATVEGGTSKALALAKPYRKKRE